MTESMDAPWNHLDRRQFLTCLSATTLFLGGHGPAAFGSRGSRPKDAPRTRPDLQSRILELDLRTAVSLGDLRAFYADTLGFPMIDQGESDIVFRAGSSRIRFKHVAGSEATPFYHFAFNIPENKILAARAWQLDKTELFLTPENLRDPAYPNDVRHFRNWNAHSIFFWDPAGNVVEYIARHDLDNRASGPFSYDDILCVSEIAFIVDDVPRHASRLQARLELDQYGSGGEPFWAVGDELGLLLLFKRGRQIGDPLRARPASADVFPTQARIRATAELALDFPSYPYRIHAIA